jgi:hypothetical protein
LPNITLKIFCLDTVGDIRALAHSKQGETHLSFYEKKVLLLNCARIKGDGEETCFGISILIHAAHQVVFGDLK